MNNFPFTEVYDVALRLGLAVTAGIILGLNRWLHHKPAGVRTHSLVALGAALAVVLVTRAVGSDAQALSRVIQGLVTGVGFIGAGVIWRAVEEQKVFGLTTAATIWASAILGIVCGTGDYVLGTVALIFMMAILFIGGPLEEGIEKMLDKKSVQKSG